MQKLVILLFVALCHNLSYGQKINYNVPGSVANNISKGDYKKIVDLAIPLIQNRFTVESLNDGTVVLAKGQGIQAFNLDNLVLKCLDVKDKTLWKDVIADHFSQIFISIDEKKKIDPNNFETVKKYLSIRVYPKQAVLQRGGMENMVLKSDMEDTYTLLMLDLPGAFTNVERSMAELWKKDSSELFKFAQANINQQIVQKVTQNFDIDGTLVEISFIGEENYAASYALDLATNSPELVGQWGSVVAMPNKGIVNVCKISKDKPLDFVKFIQRTKPLVEKYYNDHPQPISDQYFWYYKGKFTRIPVSMDANGQLNIISPLGLSELMTRDK